MDGKFPRQFMSPDIQHKILSVMAQFIQREIVREDSGKWFTIMVDETRRWFFVSAMLTAALKSMRNYV